MKKLLPIAAVLLLTACAEQAVNAEGAPRRERGEAVTGSNIVKRTKENDGSITTYDRESVERAQQGSYGGIPRVPGN